MFSLCLEAQAELAQSNKKVKDVNHSEFKEDICSSPTPPINGCGNQPPQRRSRISLWEKSQEPILKFSTLLISWKMMLNRMTKSKCLTHRQVPRKRLVKHNPNVMNIHSSIHSSFVSSFKSLNRGSNMSINYAIKRAM